MTAPITLLIVDDDVDDQEMFIEVAREIYTSLNCVKALNGQEALELLKNEDFLPDFIFLDLNMPRMNGIQCLRKLKTCEKARSIPVIIYTTSSLAEDKEQTKKLGAVHFITKPSSPVALKKELEFVFAQNWLDKKY